MDCRKALISGLATACLLAAGCVTTRGEVEHNARTMVAFGDMQASGGFTGETTPEQQAVFRQEAQLAYLAAMKKDPKYLPAYLGLARLQKACGDHVAAVGTYQQALQLEERNAGLWHEVGMLQCKLRQWEPGITSLKKAVEFDPNNGQYRSALGCSLVMAGKTDEGFAVLVQAGGPAKAHRDMAKLRSHQGQSELAKLHLAEAAKIDSALPGQPQPAAEPEAAPHGEIMQASYPAPPAAPAVAPPATPSNPPAPAVAPPAAPSAPMIIQAGVLQEPGKTKPPIDVPPLPVLSIRSK